MKYTYATRIVASEGQIENAQALLQEKPMQIGLSEPNVTTMKGKSFIILDFGKEVSGGARILTHFVWGKKTVRLRFGESVSETCAELGDGLGFATNDHSLRDFEVNLQNYSDMTFGQTGFRFLRIDTLSDDTILKIKSVVAAVDTDEREQIGSFECDDPLVNQIWDTAAYTLRLCLQNGYFWDGIKRDRLVWIGDLYPEMRAAHCLFGDVPETCNSLDFAEEQTPLPDWMNGIPLYSLWWIINLCDEYKINGEKDRFKKYLPYAKGILERISPFASEDGRVDYEYNFVDWPSYYQQGDPLTKKEDNVSGAFYLTKIAVEKLSEVLKDFGDDVSLCEDILARIAKGGAQVNTYKQIAAIGVWSGDKSENNKQVLLRDGAKGLSTFMSYPILTAVAAYGEYETALSMMKEYYGAMLSLGATSFWEDFNLEWMNNCGRIDEMPKEGQEDIHGDRGAFCYKGFRHSFCHGWSAGVVPYLAETVAGIKIEEVGMKKITISPQLSGLKHVKISYPTKYGVLKVEHTLQADGKVKTVVDAPKEIEIVLS